MRSLATDSSRNRWEWWRSARSSRRSRSRSDLRDELDPCSRRIRSRASSSSFLLSDALWLSVSLRMFFKKRVLGLGGFPVDLRSPSAGNRQRNGRDDPPPRQISLQPESRVFQRSVPRISGQQLRDVLVIAGGIIDRFPEGRHFGVVTKDNLSRHENQSIAVAAKAAAEQPCYLQNLISLDVQTGAVADSLYPVTSPQQTGQTSPIRRCLLLTPRRGLIPRRARRHSCRQELVS